MKTCEYCEREVVSEIPKESGKGRCCGIECGHRIIYGIWDEDCRQVIVEETD